MSIHILALNILLLHCSIWKEAEPLPCCQQLDAGFGRECMGWPCLLLSCCVRKGFFLGLFLIPFSWLKWFIFNSNGNSRTWDSGWKLLILRPLFIFNFLIFLYLFSASVFVNWWLQLRLSEMLLQWIELLISAGFRKCVTGLWICPLPERQVKFCG